MSVPGVGRAIDPVVRRLNALMPTGDAFALTALIGAERSVSAKRDLGAAAHLGKRIVVLTGGWACRYRLTGEGRRLITRLLLPGDICNPEALEGDRMAQGLSSITPCTVAGIEPDALQRLLAGRPSAAAGWARLLLADHAMLVEHAVGLGRRSALERIANLLCELFVRLTGGGQADAEGFEMPLTQEEIGDALGLTPVHINRVIRTLREQGLASIADHRVRISDWDGLQRLGEFDGAYLLPPGDRSDRFAGGSIGGRASNRSRGASCDVAFGQAAT